ncbi:alpha/beta hydrolase [Kiloniella sp. EL199]|uniref:alpha/beta hydrolase n=1 Tax=Kiloniella sp. EL199 TaxID=2107581 RepID=UPI000EA0CFDB|nr:alpha/beta hydrolase [Kiloniella sp. EL199]
MIDPERDKLYNVRAAIPDHMDIFAKWERCAADFNQTYAGLLDLPYGTGERTKLDLYLTENKEAPLHVFIHGGYWQAMDKSQSSFLAKAFLDAGVNVAMLGYDLCPTVTLRELVEEVRQAFVWLWHRANEYGYNQHKIQISGHSAGGHLVGMLLATDWSKYDLPSDVDPIHSAIAISGLFDLTQLVPTSINNKLGLDMGEAKALSPLFVEPENICPFLLVVGDDESNGFHQQSDNLERTWGDKFEQIDRMSVTDCHHLSVVALLAEKESALFQWAIHQLGY